MTMTRCVLLCLSPPTPLTRRLFQPGPALPYDPLVEYTDEFGRERLVPRSEVPRGAPFRDPNGNGEWQYQHSVQEQAPTAFKPGEGPQACGFSPRCRAIQLG